MKKIFIALALIGISIEGFSQLLIYKPSNEYSSAYITANRTYIDNLVSSLHNGTMINYNGVQLYRRNNAWVNLKDSSNYSANSALLQGHNYASVQTKVLSQADSSRLVALTLRVVADSGRLVALRNYTIPDTAATYNDTCKLDVLYRTYATKTLSGSISLKIGTATKTGATAEYKFKGTGNGYTITAITGSKQIGTDTYDDVLNTYYLYTIHKGSGGQICYIINKLP
jgi:hypothetical protein